MNHFDCAVRGASYFAGPHRIDHAHGYNSDPYRSQPRHSNCPHPRCVSVGLVRSICCATHLSGPSTLHMGTRTTIINMQRIARCSMRFTPRPHIRMPHLRGHFSRTMFPRHRRMRHLQMIWVAETFACIDVNEHSFHWSLRSLCRPQCSSFCLGSNSRTCRRFNAAWHRCARA
jgi:hypothetical protein